MHFPYELIIGSRDKPTKRWDIVFDNLFLVSTLQFSWEANSTNPELGWERTVPAKIQTHVLLNDLTITTRLKIVYENLLSSNIDIIDILGTNYYIFIYIKIETGKDI